VHSAFLINQSLQELKFGVANVDWNSESSH
jgi:hypothetical protein